MIIVRIFKYLSCPSMGSIDLVVLIIPRETEGYGVERVRPSVRLSVCPSVSLSVCPSVRLSVCPYVPPRHGVVCARELGMKELS